MGFPCREDAPSILNIPKHFKLADRGRSGSWRESPCPLVLTVTASPGRGGGWGGATGMHGPSALGRTAPLRVIGRPRREKLQGLFPAALWQHRSPPGGNGLGRAENLPRAAAGSGRGGQRVQVPRPPHPTAFRAAAGIASDRWRGSRPVCLKGGKEGGKTKRARGWKASGEEGDGGATLPRLHKPRKPRGWVWPGSGMTGSREERGAVQLGGVPGATGGESRGVGPTRCPAAVP